jgi:hypothetical protein
MNTLEKYHIYKTISSTGHPPETNEEKTKYTRMLLSRHKNAGQNHDIKTANIP